MRTLLLLLCILTAFNLYAQEEGGQELTEDATLQDETSPENLIMNEQPREERDPAHDGEPIENEPEPEVSEEPSTEEEK